MEDKHIDIESYKNLLLFAVPVSLYGLEIKQYKVRDLLCGYEEFNRYRQFVYLSKNTLHKQTKKDIDAYMFDVKEYLLMNYGEAGYSLEYDTFDLVAYVGYLNHAFVEFLTYFTQHTISDVTHIKEIDLLRIVYDDTKVLCLNREQFGDMMNRFCILNYASSLSDTERIEKTSAAEEFDEKKKELEDKFGFKKKQDITFNSILSWLVNDGFDHNLLINKTMYQVMDSMRRKGYMEYCKLINNARSSGNCNMKEAELKKINNAFCLY